MARIGRPLLGIALVLGLCQVPYTAADPPGDPAQAIATTLAVQDAMRQGRDLLQRGQAKDAVDVLEAQLTRINGNPTYLALLREAYYAYIKELQFNRQDELSATFLKRLRILDKDARADAPPAPPKTAAAPAAPDNVPKPPSSETVAPDDPLQQTPRRQTTGRELLPEAEKAFAEKRYREADDLFARAYGSEEVAPDHAPQWAYSKLNHVVARLQDAEAGGGPVPAAELEREVTTALQLAANRPELGDFGRKLLETIRQRGATSPASAVTVKHQERGQDGWARAESANFRLFHTHASAAAEQMLRTAEQARAAAFEKWAGPPRGDWQPVCEVYLHATAADYVRNTKKGADSPGHSTVEVKSGAVTRRRLDLRADVPTLLTCVVPHEATHLVLADLFADAPLPRWADEGMAVLAETRAQIDRHGRTLHRCRRDGQLVPLDKLLKLTDYPDAALITPFYVESVSVVEYLVAEKGPRALTQFLRDVQASGLDQALARHYGCRSVAELQERWLRRTFTEPDTRGAAGQSR